MFWVYAIIIYNIAMNKKLYTILGIILLVVLFVAVVATSVIINKKKSDIDNIPNDTSISVVYFVER